MKSKAVVNDTITVDVNVRDHIITVESKIPVPWHFHGKVQWHIVGPDAAEFDANEGVTFRAENAPFTPRPVSPTVWETAVSNTDPAVVSIPFKYTLKLRDGNAPIGDDPTVENDSPPTAVVRPVRPVRRVRRTGRNARTRV